MEEAKTPTLQQAVTEAAQALHELLAARDDIERLTILRKIQDQKD